MATVSKKQLQHLILRSQNRCPLFGAACDLPERVLPTYADVVRNYLYVQQTKTTPVYETAKLVSCNLVSIWQKASLPTINEKSIVTKVMLYLKEYRNIMRPYKKRKDEENYKVKLEKFILDASCKLFDICSCKCSEMSSCHCATKVPAMEREFLMDQRAERRMMIGTVDVALTRKLQRRSLRKEKELSYLTNSQLPSTSGFQALKDNDSDECQDTEMEQDSGNTTTLDSKTRKKTQMRKKLPHLARECDRYGVSDRAAAALASAVLQDVSVITSSDDASIIDKNKVRREREKCRKTCKQQPDSVQGLYFDGRKDETLLQERKGEKLHPIIKPEEHYTLVAEPGSHYLGHVSPPSSDAASITNEIINFIEQNDILGDIICLGCDGTVVNTGHTGGVIRLLEVYLGRPLQWNICVLHLNELPLRHLMQNLDGVTAGPKSFSGPIGKKLSEIDLPIVTFEPISCNNFPLITEDVFQDLSADQKYLFKLCRSVQEGFCAPDLANQRPGPVSHSRWLTTACRILRLYIATLNPCQSLILLATYIVRVYAPLWFFIKWQSHFQHAPMHLFRMISWSRFLPLEQKSVVDKVIQRNGFCAHEEHILLAMLMDDRANVRELALRRVLKYRNVNKGDLRVFKPREINFGADEYVSLIDWFSANSEPPVLRHVETDTLKELLENKLSANDLAESLCIPKFPCHSQAVERHVKLVTEASGLVCGTERRDGLIHSRKASQAIMKKYDSKKDFTVV